MEDRKVPLAEIEPDQPPKNKGGWVSFFVMLFGLGAFFISPAPDYLFSLIPETIIRTTLSPIIQTTTLDENPREISEPIKYQQEKPLSVLGRETGICFIFGSTLSAEDKSAINIKRLKRAKRGKIIAEIIAVTPNNKEYVLDEVTMKEGQDETKKGQEVTVICQNFSRKHSLVPERVKAIYVRPLKPFTPLRVSWTTLKDLH